VRRKKLIPVGLELVGIAAIGTGIGLELALGGQVYYAIITGGSCLVAIGGVIWGKFMRGDAYGKR
jgi:hypothetical protein